jgi:hypothetical protein
MTVAAFRLASPKLREAGQTRGARVRSPQRTGRLFASARSAVSRYRITRISCEMVSQALRDHGVDVGVGCNSAGAGEASGDGVGEAAASLVLASSSIFFSSG